MEFIYEGEMVEGAHCDADARRPDMKGPKYDPITNKRMMLFEFSRNSSIEVTKEMVYGSNEDRQLREIHNVHTKLGDKLIAKKLQMFVDTKRCVPYVVKEGVTATHGAHIYQIKERTIGKIKYSLDMYRTKLQQLAESNLKAISKL